MLKRVAAIGSSTAVIGALLTGAFSTPALAACTTAAEPTASDGVRQVSEGAHLEWILADTSRWSLDYALTTSFTYTCTWTNQAIGNSTTKFTGTFDGGGYTISGLTIDGGTSTDYMGLFGYTDGATITNLTFGGPVVGNANVGGLIGQADNTNVANSGATGAVTGDDDQVGGLIGLMNSGTTVVDSWATGEVLGDGSDSDDVGGLIGEANNSEVVRSWATGNVDGDDDRVGGLLGQSENTPVTDSWATGSVDGDDEIGGLAGEAFGAAISSSWASGSVSGDNNVGGSVGLATDSRFSNAWASGAVSGQEDVGGLIGELAGSEASVTGSYATGTTESTDLDDGDDVGGLIGVMGAGTSVSQSYATGAVTGVEDDIGGLVGDAGGSITQSWASGAVRGIGTGASGDPVSSNVGGLVGILKGSITDAYALGNVSGTGSDIGGLVGESEGAVLRSYSIGSATGSTNGGLVGNEDTASGGSESGSYWNTETSGLSSSDGGTGKTTTEMQDVTTYAGWSIAQGFNSSLTWAICLNVNSGYPYFTWSYSSDPCITDVDYQFTFRLPDGTECGAIGPVGVVDGTIYILPGEDADCRTMEGALVGGWTIPVPEGYDSIGSPAMPFAPGQKVRVSDSQQFTVVPFEPLLSLTLDSNVMADEACEANEVEFVDEANREEYSWVPRGDISMARLPMVAACQPPGYTLAGWNTASDGSGTMFEPGAGLPSEWATDKTNRYRLFAIWSPA